MFQKKLLKEKKIIAEINLVTIYTVVDHKVMEGKLKQRALLFRNKWKVRMSSYKGLKLNGFE